jgi:VWFA-related protein
MLMSRFVPAALITLLSMITFAQHATDSGEAPALTLSITTRLVYVDVLVRDAHGNMVKGLTEQDFKISENGHPQKLDYFAAHTPESPDATPANAASGSKTEFTNTNGSSTRPMIIVLFDLLNTPADDQLTGRPQMLKFLHSPPEGERISVFTLSNTLEMTQGVTGSPQLTASVSKMLRPSQSSLVTSRTEAMMDDQVANNFIAQSAPGGGSPAQTAEGGDGAPQGNKAMSNSGSRSNQENYETRARSTIAILGELAKDMGGYPGRKSLYWVSENFPLSIDIVGAPVNSDPSGGSAAQFNTKLLSSQGHFSQTYQQEMAITLNKLAAARISVYPTSIFGLATESSSVAVTAAAGGGVNPGDPRGGFFTLNNLKVEMDDLARETGGEAIFGNNDIAGAMRRTIDDSATYYTLAYNPTETKFDGLFRSIKVEAGHGNSLIYRRGYFADPKVSALNTAEDLARAMQPNVPEETGLRLHSRVMPPDPQYPGLKVITTIDTADVFFAETPEGHRRAKLFVQLVAFDDADKQPKSIPQTSGTLNIDLDPDKYKFILTAGIAFPPQLHLKPGKYRLLLGVNDQNSHRLGTVEMPLTVQAN